MDSQGDAQRSLEYWRLEGWREIGRELGRGSYAAVIEVDYKGLKCAGKKIHRVLYENGEGDLVRRFEEECRLLSQLRHPHIVQFLGVYFDEHTNVPVLVMEFLPTTLAQTLDRYGLLPEEINYSILRDVSLGLRYLHERRTPIVHRDLSANNVLLSDNMMAKISDLGVAKILGLTPNQKSMTQGPGTLCYMSPEALVPDPHYDIKIDIFSFGVLIAHVLSGEWPFPKEAVKVNPDAPSLLTPVSEMDRRSQCIEKIADGHPLIQLISQCLHNSPIERPITADVCQQMDYLASQHPAVFENRVELLQQIHAVQEERASLRYEIRALHLAEAPLRSEIQVLKTCYNCTEAEIAELRSEYDSLKETQNTKDQAHASQLEGERKEHEAQIAIIQEQLQAVKEGQQRSHQAQIQVKEAKQEALLVELEESRSSVSRKEATIEKLKEQLGQLQETLLHSNQVHTPFPPEMKLDWSQCADLPVGMCRAQAVLIDESIYMGGGFTANMSDHSLVFKYNNIIKNNWTQLPPAPVQYFGLGQLRGKVVLVGGLISFPKEFSAPVGESATPRIKDANVSANLYTLNDTQYWTESFPPMPTARQHPAVVSYKGSALIVCGGVGRKFLDTVELFKIETSQWCGLRSLPFPWSGMSVATMGDTCFLMGGRTDGNVPSKAVIVCRMNQLIADPDTPWKALPDCPHTLSVVAVLNGCVLSIGGGSSKVQSEVKTGRSVLGFRFRPRSQTLTGFNSSDNIYVYCPTVSRWIQVGVLPAPCSFYSALVLPTNKLVVIGGIESGPYCTTMWQGKINIP